MVCLKCKNKIIKLILLILILNKENWKEQSKNYYIHVTVSQQ